MEDKNKIFEETCFVIGNGESRLIWKDWNALKNIGTVYGCNAIVRDYPDLCKKIFVVNPPLYDEIVAGKEKNGITGDIVGLDRISKWNYLDGLKDTLPSTKKTITPAGLKIYRIWQGGDAKKAQWRLIDVSKGRGSGCSAVLDAAESGFKNIFIIGFDIVGAQQWEHKKSVMSRAQNNIYKNTPHYPDRMNMKAYLKYEWMYQLTQTALKFPGSKFIHINRLENLKANYLLPDYFKHARGNCRAASYAELKKFTEDPVNYWHRLKWIIK
jgi:hypothetical protein